MKAIAFEMKIKDGLIKIPLNYQEQLKEDQTVKIVDSINTNIDDF